MPMYNIFDNIDNPILLDNNKRVSKECKKSLIKLQQIKKYIIIIFLLILILPLLYLIPCNTTIVDIKFNKIKNNNININAYSIDLKNNINTSINIIDNNYTYVQSIDLYFNSYETIDNNINMIKKIAYHTDELNSLNTLKYEIYRDTGNYKSLHYFSYNYYRYDFPTDWSLSYLKIQVHSIPNNNQNISFNITYYGFFQDLKYIQLKSQYIIQINILNFTFNNDAYKQWYNYVILKNTNIIPSIYPYNLDVSVKRYNDLTELLSIENI